MTSQRDGGQQREFSYGYDIHCSVSMLLDNLGAARAAYGYTAYGDAEIDLTAGATPRRALVGGNPVSFVLRRVPAPRALARSGRG